MRRNVSSAIPAPAVFLRFNSSSASTLQAYIYLDPALFISQTLLRCQMFLKASSVILQATESIYSSARMATRGGNVAQDNFPYAEEIKKEMEQIKGVRVGDASASLARIPQASAEIDDALNKCIAYHANTGALFAAASAFFSHDNVALPGVALYCKIKSQIEINDSWRVIDFLVKRGARVEIGSVAQISAEHFSQRDQSDLLYGFSEFLAVSKVGYKKANDLLQRAAKVNDACAEVFLARCVKNEGEKVRCASHQVAHLKRVEGDKHAMKEFDRNLPFLIEELACAAGIEASIPARLQMGTELRAWICQNKQLVEGSEREDPANSLLRRRIFNKVV